jgi:site-specific recombinase XerD
LFPSNFRLVLKSHLQAHPQNRYLLESQRNTRFTARRIQQLVQGYRRAPALPRRCNRIPSRHQMITWLTSRGLSDAQIQLISGHESKKSLEVHQHLALNTVEHAYQETVRSIST